MTREEMVNALVDMFKESDQDSIMISAACRENKDGTCDVKIMQNPETELFMINGQPGQTIEHLCIYFENLLQEAIDVIMNENKSLQDVSPAEF